MSTLPPPTAPRARRRATVVHGPGSAPRRSARPRDARSVRLALVGLAALVLALGACSGRLSGDKDKIPLPKIPDFPELPPPTAPTTPSLVSAAPGAGSVRLDWIRGDEDDPAPPEGDTGTVLALFVGTTPSDVYDAAPVVDPLEGTTLTLTGLVDGTPLVFGLAEVVEAGFAPTGEVLTVVPGAPVYCRADADPTLADGLTPATAFASPFLAVLTAFGAGGGNVWLAGGDYAPFALPIFPGVHLYGGFDPTFDLALRDPEALPTVLRGVPNQPVAAIQDTVETMVVDGLVFDGGTVARAGFEITDSEVELRRVIARTCLGPGIRLNAADDQNPLGVKLVDCLATGNLAEGLSLSGALDLVAHGCRFETNVQEGLDGDDLIAPDDETASARLVECRFAGNGAEGLDIDLGTPLFGGVVGGVARISVERCVFESNLGAGVIVDVDFEAEPLWSGTVELIDITSRGNGAEGLLLDIDGPAPTFVHGGLFAANAGDGVTVRSEVFPGLAVISASASLGNIGAGIRSTVGNTAVLVSHGVVSGNGDGGIVAEAVRGGVSSTVAWLQPSPFANAAEAGTVVVDDVASPTLNALPVLFSDVASFDDVAGSVTLAAGAPVPEADAVLELQADDVARTILSFVTETELAVDPAPAFLVTPTRLAAWPAGSDVLEDWRVLPGTAAEGAGMAPPGGDPVDAGPLASPAGDPPGAVGDPAGALFRLATTSPPAGTTPGPGETLVLGFLGGVLDPGSVGASSVVLRDGTGAEVPTTPFAQDGDLHVPEPAGGWPAGATLELHRTLGDTDGAPLAAPVVVPFAP